MKRYSDPRNYPSFKHEYLNEIEYLNTLMPAWMHYPKLREQFNRLFSLKSPKKAEVVSVYLEMKYIVNNKK